MRVGIIVGVIASSAIAFAQPAPEAPPPDEPHVDAPPPAPPAPPAPPTIDPRADAGWTLYHRSFGALVRGDRALAKSLVLQLARDQPQHPAIPQLRADWPVDAVEPPAALAERPSRGARAELALFQSFHGMALGVELGVLMNLNDGAGYLLLALAGAGGGVGASLVIEGLTPGDRALADSGTAWGEIETGLLLGSLKSSVSGKRIAGALMVGSLGGLALGGAMAMAFHPTQGQVALANSGGIWTGALTTLVLAFADHNTANEHFTETAMVASAVGIAGGAYLAKLYPETSRGKTLVIDAGGVVGGIVALAAGVIVANGKPSDRAATGLAIVGVSAGLGAGAFLTRHWDLAPSSNVPTAYVVPVERGTGGIAGLQFGW